MKKKNKIVFVEPTEEEMEEDTREFEEDMFMLHIWDKIFTGMAHEDIRLTTVEHYLKKWLKEVKRLKEGEI